MKLVLFQTSERDEPSPGLLTDRGVVGLAGIVERSYTPQLTMQGLIESFDGLRPALERQAAEGEALPLGSVRLRAPLPRPGKILCCIANYWEHAQRETRPLNMFLKNPEAVVGPGDTIVLPEFTEPWIFMHEAELALVIKGPAKKISQANWKSAVFGYTCMIDVSARGEGRRTWKAGSWLGKSFDTFAPLGPCIASAEEIPEPNDLVVRFWNDGQLRHNYNTDDIEHWGRDRLRHQSRRARRIAGRRDSRDRDPAHRPHVAERRRPVKAQLGARHLHGSRLDQPPSHQTPPPASRDLIATEPKDIRLYRSGCRKPSGSGVHLNGEHQDLTEAKRDLACGCWSSPGQRTRLRG